MHSLNKFMYDRIRFYWKASAWRMIMMREIRTDGGVGDGFYWTCEGIPGNGEGSGREWSDEHCLRAPILALYYITKEEYVLDRLRGNCV